MTHRLSRQHAFTLVELLIVIAIIAILASLLLPGLSKAKSQAHRAQCVSNQRQLIFTWLMYAGDHDEQLVPNGVTVVNDSGNSRLWVYGLNHPNLPAFTNDLYLVDPRYAAFAPYLRTPKIYRCPADRGELFILARKTDAVQRNRSYSLNAYLGPTAETVSVADYITPRHRWFKKMSDISSPSPSSLWVFQDVNPGSICFPGFVVRMSPEQSSSYFHYPGTYHNRAGVLTFADGHVDTHRWKDPRTFKNAQTGGYLLHTPMPGSDKNEESGPNADLTWLRAHTSVGQ